MKINCPSYNILISPDETILVNNNNKVSLFAITKNGFNELKQFNVFKNPSRAALSSDGKMLAYSNTSGHIAVHDIETGNLLVKSKCLSKEGYNLHFVNNDTQIISSEWSGDVFILDIESGKTTMLNSFPLHNSTNLMPIAKNHFIVIGSILAGGTLAYNFQIDNNEATFTELFSSYPHRLESSSFICSENEVFFYGGNTNNSSSTWLNKDIAENSLFSYSFSTKKFCSIIDIQQLLGINCSLNSDYGYFASMCISKSKQYALIGFSNSIIIVDLLNKKHIGTIKAKYLSSLNFVKSDTEVIVGTWNNIQIIDFQDLCQMEQC